MRVWRAPVSIGRWADERDQRARSDQAVRRFRRRGPPHVRGARRGNLRVPGQQRRRQIDGHPHDVRAVETERRDRHRGRNRCRPRSRGRQAPHRVHVAAVLALRAIDCGSKHPVLRRHLWSAARPARGAPAVRARNVRASVARARACGRSRRRVAAAPGTGLRDSSRAADRVSRRADGRRGSRIPP